MGLTARVELPWWRWPFQGEYNDKDLGTLKPRFQLSVVRSCARLTYAQAQRFLDMAPPTNVVLHQGVTMQQVRRTRVTCDDAECAVLHS